MKGKILERKKKSGLNRDVVLGREFTEVEILSGKFWRKKMVVR